MQRVILGHGLVKRIDLQCSFSPPTPQKKGTYSRQEVADIFLEFIWHLQCFLPRGYVAAFPLIPSFWQALCSSASADIHIIMYILELNELSFVSEHQTVVIYVYTSPSSRVWCLLYLPTIETILLVVSCSSGCIPTRRIQCKQLSTLKASNVLRRLISSHPSWSELVNVLICWTCNNLTCKNDHTRTQTVGLMCQCHDYRLFLSH